MAAKNIIYRFPNATVLFAPGNLRSIILLNDGVEVSEHSHALTTEIMEALGTYSYRAHFATEGKLQLVSSSWSREVLSYIPKDRSSELKELDEESYEKISENFKRFYERKLAEPVETRTELEYELVEVPYDLKGEILIGKEFASDLHAKALPIRDREQRGSYYDRNRLRASISNNLPLDLTGAEIRKLVDALGNEVAGRNGYSASLRQYGYLGDGDFDVTFYEVPYQGAVKKVLDKKQNGQPYADRRGRMVRDMPKSVGQAKITATDLANWWASVEGNKLSDDAKLEALRTLTNHLWRA